MSRQVSANVRYLLWRKGVPREQWEGWLASRTSLPAPTLKALMTGHLADEQVTPEVLRDVARAFEHGDEGESLRFADLAQDGGSVLLENLKFLFESLGHGGKKTVAAELSIDPTTVSRWLSGAYEPQAPSLRQIVTFFGLPPETDLRETPVFLSVEPVAVSERRRWLHSRIDALAPDEFRELYPALRRMLEDR
jgi:hypothetical protein